MHLFITLLTRPMFPLLHAMDHEVFPLQFISDECVFLRFFFPIAEPNKKTVLKFYHVSDINSVYNFSLRTLQDINFKNIIILNSAFGFSDSRFESPLQVI